MLVALKQKNMYSYRSQKESIQFLKQEQYSIKFLTMQDIFLGKSAELISQSETEYARNAWSQSVIIQIFAEVYFLYPF